MNILKLIMLGLFAFSTPVILAACEQETPAEETMEEVSDEIDDATTN